MGMLIVPFWIGENRPELGFGQSGYLATKRLLGRVRHLPQQFFRYWPLSIASGPF